MKRYAFILGKQGKKIENLSSQQLGPVLDARLRWYPRQIQFPQDGGRERGELRTTLNNYKPPSTVELFPRKIK